MSESERKPGTAHGRSPRRGRAVAGRFAAGGVAALALVLLLAAPLHLHPIDGWIHRVVGHGGGAATAENAGQKQLWTCGMHPQVIQDHPGQCPICGMDLVPLRTEAEPATSGGPTVTIDPAVVQNMNVTTEPVQRGDVHREIRTVGTLDYDQEKMVSVTTKYDGFIERSYVGYVGQPVQKGERLFDVFSPQLLQTEQELLSSLEYARKMQDAPQDARDRAASLVDAARSRLGYWDITPDQIDRLEKSGSPFRTLSVVAPFSGVVMRRMDALEGMAVRPGMELLNIVNLSSLWMTAQIFEDQLPWVDVGTPASVSLTYFPGETFTGKVRYVEPSVSEKTRSVQVTLDVPNPSGRLRAGMYATVTFAPVVAPNALTVPSQAVLRTGERNLVVVALGGGRFAPRDVVLGAEGDGVVEVKSGLKDGDVVVTSAQFLIDSESNLHAAIEKMIAGREH